MRRFLVPIILFAIGVVVLLLAILKVVPGVGGAGGGLLFLGALLFGLSFIKKPGEAEADSAPPLPGEAAAAPKVAEAAPPPLSPFERIAGMFYEPTKVFKNLRYHPYWLAPILVMAVFSIIYSNAFVQRVTPERIGEQQAQGLRGIEESGWMPPGGAEKARLQTIEELKNPVARVGMAINAVVGLITIFAILGALYLLFLLMFGGRANFWQTMAISASAALPIVVIQKALSLVILYIKSPDSIHPLIGQNTLVEDNLGILFKSSEHPVLYVMGASIGVLALVELWLTATGLKNGGQKVTSTAAWGAAISIWVLGFIFKVAITALFPNFVS